MIIVLIILVIIVGVLWANAIDKTKFDKKENSMSIGGARHCVNG